MCSKTFNLWLSWCGSFHQGLSVRAQVQKGLRFVCCWFFLETCGFVTSATIHWPVLPYCLILSTVEKNCLWQQNASIFLKHKPPSGALFFFFCLMMMVSFIRTSSCLGRITWWLSLLKRQTFVCINISFERSTEPCVLFLQFKSIFAPKFRNKH